MPRLITLSTSRDVEYFGLRSAGVRTAIREPIGVSFHAVIQSATHPMVTLAPSPLTGLTRRIDSIYLWSDAGSLWILQYIQNSVIVGTIGVHPLAPGIHKHIEGPFYQHGTGDALKDYSLDVSIYGTMTCGTITAYGVEY
jgi:hypothetical protein